MTKARTIAAALAILALAVCLGSSIWVFAGSPPEGTAYEAWYEGRLATYKVWFNWATLLWFLAGPVWITPGLFRERKAEEPGSAL